MLARNPMHNCKSRMIEPTDIFHNLTTLWSLPIIRRTYHLHEIELTTCIHMRRTTRPILLFEAKQIIKRTYRMTCSKRKKLFEYIKRKWVPGWVAKTLLNRDRNKLTGNYIEFKQEWEIEVSTPILPQETKYLFGYRLCPFQRNQLFHDRKLFTNDRSE